MPRPRTVPDADILEATARTIARLGPARVTLAHVGREVGLSPATLVQRFGSKRGLLLALAGSALEWIDSCFDLVRSQHADPLEALLVAATEMTRHTTSPEEMANHLAFLQIDLSDPEFRQLTRESTDRTLAGYRALLDEAVAVGRLVPCDTSRLARAIGALSGGSLIGWAVQAEGPAEAWVRTDLETLLTPYQRDAATGGSSPVRAGTRRSGKKMRSGKRRRSEGQAARRRSRS